MPTLTRARGRRALALTAGIGALSLGLVACGSSSDKDPDPAQAVPASAPIYAQVTVAPDGDLKANTEAVLKKLGVNDPAADIDKFLKSSTTRDENVDKIKEWIGSRAGVFVTSFTGEPDAALVMSTTDPGKALDSLDKDGKKKGSYKDVDYWFDDGGSVDGVVGDYAVSGTERAFRTVVDTVKGDDVETIADNADYQKGLDTINADDALATAYVSTEGVLNALGRSGGIPAAQLGQIRQQLSQYGGKSTVLKLSPGQDKITVQVATTGLPEGSGTDDGAANTALTALPGDAWLGIGLPRIGETLRTAMTQGLSAASVSGQDVEGQIQAAEQALGIDIEDDLLSWMGNGGLFARGTTITDIGGALVVQTTDPAKTKQALTKLSGLLPQITTGLKVSPLSGVAGADDGFQIESPSLPFPIIAAVGGDKFVLGIGAQTVEAALSPSSTLGDSAAYKTAAAALGETKPAFFLDVGAVSALIGGLVPTDDPNVRQVVAALNKISTIASGTTREGSTQLTTLVVTLK